MGEGRRFPRIGAENAVLVSRLGSDELEGFVRTREMGAGGCCFVSADKQIAGALLKLLISIRHEVIEVRSRVAWVREIDDAHYDIGVEFLDISGIDAQRIAALFEEC